MLAWSFLHRLFSLVLAGALVAAGLLVSTGQYSPSSTQVVPSEGEPAQVEQTEVPLVDAGEEPEAAPESAEDDGSAGMGGGDIEAPVAELSREDTDPFTLLGVTWEATPGVETAAVEVQWRSTAGGWSEWTTLETSEVAAVEGARPGTEPLWVGESDGVAVRVATGSGTPPEDLKVVTVSDGESPEMAPAAATVGQPRIISRSAWGATGGSSCSSPVYGASTLGTTLHHTAGSNSYTKAQSAGIVRSTQAYHTRGQGWCDIGYNILVDKYGQIFEGRKGGISKQVRAAHAGVSAVNERTLGISMMGNYDVAEPSSAMKTAVADVIAWRHSIAGLKATGTYTLGGKRINRIAGHRDVKATACPGRYGYAWLNASGGLRSLVAKRLDAAGTKMPTPKNLRSTSATSSSMSFAWDAVSGAKRYHVKVSTSSNLSSPVYGKFDTNQGTVTGLKAGTRYYFVVVVVDPVPNTRLSDYSSAVSASTPAAALAPATASSNSFLNVPSNGSIKLTGRGYGHGIGMSQYGAQNAAAQGRSAAQILSYYYPGTTLGTRTGNMRVRLSDAQANAVRVRPRSGLVLRAGLSASSKRITLPAKDSKGKTITGYRITAITNRPAESKLQAMRDGRWSSYNNIKWTGTGQFEAPGPITFRSTKGDRLYRGAIRAALSKGAHRERMSVNVLKLDWYVRGVVAAEMPSSWRPAALQAQSIAARTYAERYRGKGGHFDICDTTSCQVYRGRSAETANTDAAVRSTAGRIVEHQGKPALTQFSSSSGGRSAKGSEPYLQDKTDQYDNWSGNPNHEWTITVKASTLEKKYPKVGTLRTMTIKRSGSGSWGGRVVSLELVGSKGKQTITGNDARWTLGLKSNWFRFG